jgi:putative addiction module killer protein
MTMTVFVYVDKAGKEPFTQWLYRLRDDMARRRILSRLRRLEHGNRGDCKPLQGGVHELRLLFGPGYRIYYGEDGNKLTVLLCGGDKSSQQDDIKRARKYWNDYKTRT